MMLTGITHDFHNQEGGQRGSKVLQKEEHAPSQPVTSGGGETTLKNEDLWTCRRCGWTYPNAHPSAKHRRNHKKHCGKPKGNGQGHSKSSSDASTEASSEDEGHVNSQHGNGKHRLHDLKDIPSERNNHLMDKEIGDSQSKRTEEFQVTPSEGSQKVQNNGLPVQPKDQIEEGQLIEQGPSQKVQNNGLPVQPKDQIEEGQLIEQGLATLKLPDGDGSQHQAFLQQLILPITRENNNKNDLDHSRELRLGSECETSGTSFPSDKITEEHHLRKPTNKECLITVSSAIAQSDRSVVIADPSVIIDEAGDPSNNRLENIQEAVILPDSKSMTVDVVHPLEEVQGSVVPQNILLDKHSTSDSSPEVNSEVASNKSCCTQPPFNHHSGGLSETGLKESLHEENPGMTLATVTAAVSDERQGHDVSDQGLRQEGDVVGQRSEAKEGSKTTNGEIVFEDSNARSQPLRKESVELVSERPNDTTQADADPKVEYNNAEENSSLVDLVAEENNKFETALHLEHPSQTIKKNALVNGDSTKQHVVDRNAHISEGENSYDQEYIKSRPIEVHTPQLWEQLLDAEVEKNKPSEVEDTILLKVVSPNAISDDQQSVNDSSSEYVRGDRSNSLLTQNTDAPSSLNLGSQFLDGSVQRTLEQAQPTYSMAGTGAGMLETFSPDSHLAVYESSQTPENPIIPSDIRGEKSKETLSADGSSIEMETIRNIVEPDGDGKHHTSLEVLLSKDPNSTRGQGKQEEIASSTDRSSSSSKGSPLVRKVLGRVLSSPAELSSSKPVRDKPKTKPKWGIFVCCSAVN